MRAAELEARFDTFARSLNRRWLSSTRAHSRPWCHPRLADAGPSERCRCRQVRQMPACVRRVRALPDGRVQEEKRQEALQARPVRGHHDEIGPDIGLNFEYSFSRIPTDLQ